MLTKKKIKFLFESAIRIHSGSNDKKKIKFAPTEIQIAKPPISTAVRLEPDIVEMQKVEFTLDLTEEDKNRIDYFSKLLPEFSTDTQIHDFLQKAMDWYENGFGFKLGVEEKPYHYVLCYCNKLTTRQILYIREMTGSLTVECCRLYKGIYGIVVFFTEYKLIDKILSYLLRLKISFITTTNLCVKFDPTEVKYYNRGMEESLAIMDCLENLEYHFEGRYHFNSALYNINNWSIDAGKDLCRRLNRECDPDYQ
jgi:hypothetical protein